MDMESDSFIVFYLSGFMAPSEQCTKQRFLAHNYFSTGNTLFSEVPGGSKPRTQGHLLSLTRGKNILYNTNVSKFVKYKKTLKIR